MVGGIIEFDIVQKNDKKHYIEKPVFTPTVYHFKKNFCGNKVYYLQDYTTEFAKNN